MKKPRKRQRTWNNQEAKLIALADDISAFEEFKKELLPALRADLKQGLSTQDLLQKYKAIAAARMLMVMVGKSDALASQAAKDVLNRADGKPAETKTIKHKYAELTDEQLQALYHTKMSDLKNAAADMPATPSNVRPTEGDK